MSNLATTKPVLPPLTSREAKARLDAQSALIQVRAEALQREVMTAGDAVKDAVAKDPWVSVGGGLASGAVVGLVLGGIGKSRRRRKAYAARTPRGYEEAPPPLVGTQPQPGLIRTFVGVAMTALVSAAIRQGVYKLVGNDEPEMDDVV